MVQIRRKEPNAMNTWEYNGGASKGGAVLRALVSHQCNHGRGSNPGVDAICWLSLMSVVLSLAPRGFFPGTPVFSSL